VASVWHMGGMPLSLLTALERAAVPMVLNLCDDWPVYAPATDAWLDGWSRRPAAFRALADRLTGLPTSLPDLDRHRAFFVSAFTRDSVRARGRWGFGDAVVIPLGVDGADFPVIDQPPRQWGGRLLGVGRLEPRKGFDTAVRALPLLPGVHLELLGVADPEHLAELEQLAEQLGVRERVTFSAVPRSQLRERYAAADAVIFPSRWDEPFGLVPLEAMTQGTPVVATRQGGSAEFLVDGVNCLAVPKDDPVAVTAAVNRLATDPALRDRLTRGGQATAERLTADRLAESLEELHAAALPTPVTVAPLEQASSRTFSRPAEVAVVVSTHARSEYLSGLLACLDAQEHSSFEVVICDNGSPDGTWGLLTSWVASTEVPAHVLRVPFHDGPAVPRNTALERTRAPLLAFTDDDCLPSATWLSALTAGLADPAVAVVQGRTQPESDGWAGPWGRSLTVQSVTGLCETANLGCRREGFFRAGGFPSRRLLSGRAFGEDVLLGAALARHGRVVFRSDAAVEHRVLPGSYRGFLQERYRLGGFPLLARAVPAVRRNAVLGIFLSRRTACVDIGVLGLLLAAATRRVAPATAALPWARLCWRAAAGRPGRPRAVRTTQIAVGDLVGLAALVTGSVRARRPLL
ncbi:MAG: glycosyltransferase, partial [Actinomycetota bacterium]|nr:glycosyltransferase [Actinomycetota bacterium]